MADRILLVDPNTNRVIATVGYTGQGKTMFLVSLFGSLMDGRGFNFGGKCLVEPVNPQAFSTVVDGWSQLRQGQLPAGTGVVFAEPSLLRCSGLSDRSAEYLMLFDMGGGVFERWESTASEPRIRHFFHEADVLAVTFSFSVEGGARNLQLLMQSYINQTVALPGGAASLARKRVLLIYTKGDELLPVFDTCGYGDVCNYLMAEPDIIDDDYLVAARYMSNRLAAFTRESIPGGAGFHDLCCEHFGSVHYCLVSALGSAPGEGRRCDGSIVPPWCWSPSHSLSRGSTA